MKKKPITKARARIRDAVQRLDDLRVALKPHDLQNKSQELFAFSKK